MDRATIVGIVIGFLLVSAAIWLGPTRTAFWDVPSLLIVLGGTAATTLIKFPLRVVLSSMRVARNAFVEHGPSPTELVQAIVRLADVVRRDSLLAMERVPVSDRFLKRAVDICLDGVPPEMLESVLRSEVASVVERHERGHRLFRGMGQSAPAFGMIGTLIGLVQMLTQMDDPSKIGSSMAVAILTTFYGAFLAYMLFNPIADKLAERTRLELVNREIVVQGLLSILAGHHPRMVERRLFGLLEPGGTVSSAVRRNERVRAAA